MLLIRRILRIMYDLVHGFRMREVILRREMERRIVRLRCDSIRHVHDCK